MFNVHGNEYLNRHAGTDWGLILHVFIERQRSNCDIKYQLVPVTIGASNQVAASKGEQRERQLRLLAEFSHGLADWRVIRRARMKRCVAELRMQAFGLYYLWRRRGLVTAVREVIRVLQSAYERRWMYSLLSMGIFG